VHVIIASGIVSTMAATAPASIARCICVIQENGSVQLMRCERGLTVLSRADVAGIDAEGLYRVSGFHSDIEAIKLSLDRGAFC